MVLFDQLRISDDGRRMYINLHVNGADMFDDITLKDITIMASEQVSETAPYGVIVDESTGEVKDGTYIYHKPLEGKSADLVLEFTDFNEYYTNSTLSGPLFFVYVRVQGTPGECTPCPLDKETTLGVTFDESELYQKVMNYTRELGDTCKVPQDFVDFILQWNAFKASVETEHYIPAIEFYNMMFANISTGKTSGHTITHNCGCHG